jgi:hypothetical protein
MWVRFLSITVRSAVKCCLVLAPRPSLVSALCLLLVLFGGTQCDAATRILFIGNSYTYFNAGIDTHLQGLAPSIETRTVVRPGYTLGGHWNDGVALRIFHEERWDFVILQEQSALPVAFQAQFFEAVRKFDHEIRKAGAKTMLLMTWQPPDRAQYGITTKNLAAAYNLIGSEIGAIVAPAGMAFEASLQSRPDLPLTYFDGHPTLEGTYLAACVVYALVLEQPPIGNLYPDIVMPPSARLHFQSVAAEATCEVHRQAD